MLTVVTAEWRTDTGKPGTLEASGTTDSGWAKGLTETGPVTAPLAWYGGLACGNEEPASEVAERIALIERGTCAFTEKVANAEKHGALAALLFTDDRPKVRMSGSCDPCPEIPAVMIDRPPGLQLVAELAAQKALTVTLAPVNIAVEGIAVDHQARLREFGFIPYPFNDYLEEGGVEPLDSLQQVAFEAQYFHHEHERDSRLAAEEAVDAVTIVPLIEGEWAADPSWAGVKAYAEVDLPDAETMATYDTLELDLALGCADRRHSNCPAWDYIVHLYLCDAEDPDKCNLEIGRWITPYWSESHWVTDITPMLGYIAAGGTRRFAFYTQQRYQVDPSLRFSNREKGVTPKRSFDLGLNGGPFWKDYNKRFHPVEFEVPEWVEKVEIASFITGHGFGKDKENCAEFCNHTHHISINGHEEHAKLHPEANRVLGCLEQVPDGVVPNQGGTWVYGRAAWCPGLDVKPWVIDVTDEVTKGVVNELTYRGLFDGKDYVAEKGPGQDPNQGFDANIRMRSYIVYSAGERIEAGPIAPPRPRIPGTIYLPVAALDGGGRVAAAVRTPPEAFGVTPGVRCGPDQVGASVGSPTPQIGRRPRRRCADPPARRSCSASGLVTAGPLFQKRRRPSLP